MRGARYQVESARGTKVYTRAVEAAQEARKQYRAGVQALLVAVHPAERNTRLTLDADAIALLHTGKLKKKLVAMAGSGYRGAPPATAVRITNARGVRYLVRGEAVTKDEWAAAVEGSEHHWITYTDTGSREVWYLEELK